MSDHIDDSTTDEEIQATVMRDKVRAKRDTPPAETGRKYWCCVPSKETNGHGHALHCENSGTSKKWSSVNQYWGELPAAEPAAPVSPPQPEFYLIGKLKCFVCQEEFRSNEEFGKHLDESGHRLDATVIPAGEVAPVSPRCDCVDFRVTGTCNKVEREAGTVGATPESAEEFHRRTDCTIQLSRPIVQVEQTLAEIYKFAEAYAAASLPSPAPQEGKYLSGEEFWYRESSHLDVLSREQAIIFAEAYARHVLRAASPALPVGSADKEQK